MCSDIVFNIYFYFELFSNIETKLKRFLAYSSILMYLMCYSYDLVTIEGNQASILYFFIYLVHLFHFSVYYV